MQQGSNNDPSKRNFSTSSQSASSTAKYGSETSANADLPEAEQSLIRIVTSQIPPEAREALDTAAKHVMDLFNGAKKYVKENPREAAIFAVGAGFTVWTMLNTAPGKKAYSATRTAFIPRLKEWVAKIFSSAQTQIH